ncbi:hypothetical protein ACFZDG_34060 [Kitasatospora xanthocidica]|uniref:hypothetical protein n=1 Tax=Kitasatospora xanthocidica TaxID=83382 RepID=UPI0036F06E2B
MMTWAEAMACGAGGGLIAEAVVTFGRVRAWQQARHAQRAVAGDIPAIGAFIDPPADGLAALFRVLLGGMAGWLLHSEVTGVYAAVAVGASAPALLAQLGRSTTADGTLQKAPGDQDPGASPPLPNSGLPPVPEEATP